MILNSNPKWGKHWSTKFCLIRSKRRQQLHYQIEMEHMVKGKLKIDDAEVERLSSVKYLGSTLTEDGQDYMTAQINLNTDKLRWKNLQKNSKYRKGNPKIMKFMYCEVILPILLYCSETWCITERIKNMLEVFHHKVARDLNRRKFLKFWTGRYGGRIANWAHVRKNNDLTMQHIKLKTLGEYWENRTRNFRENSLGSFGMGYEENEYGRMD